MRIAVFSDVHGNAVALRAMLADLDRAAVEVETLSVHSPDLDDVFLALTGPEKVTVP